MNVFKENFHPLSHVEQTLAQLTDAQVSTKLDTNSGLWQISLAWKSHLLTTFITPFGRYCFNKLPLVLLVLLNYFKITWIQCCLGYLEYHICLMNDALIFGKDQAENDKHLKTVLKQIESADVTLNVNFQNLNWNF